MRIAWCLEHLGAVKNNVDPPFPKLSSHCIFAQYTQENNICLSLCILVCLMVPGLTFWRSVRNVLQPQLNLGFVCQAPQTSPRLWEIGTLLRLGGLNLRPSDSRQAASLKCLFALTYFETNSGEKNCIWRGTWKQAGFICVIEQDAQRFVLKNETLKLEV